MIRPACIVLLLASIGCSSPTGSDYSGGGFRVIAASPAPAGQILPEDVLPVPTAPDAGARGDLVPGPVAIAELGEPHPPAAALRTLAASRNMPELVAIPGGPNVIAVEKQSFGGVHPLQAMADERAGRTPALTAMSIVVEDARRRGARRLLLMTAIATSSKLNESPSRRSDSGPTGTRQSSSSTRPTAPSSGAGSARGPEPTPPPRSGTAARENDTRTGLPGPSWRTWPGKSAETWHGNPPGPRPGRRPPVGSPRTTLTSPGTSSTPPPRSPTIPAS